MVDTFILIQGTRNRRRLEDGQVNPLIQGMFKGTWGVYEDEKGS